MYLISTIPLTPETHGAETLFLLFAFSIILIVVVFIFFLREFPDVVGLDLESSFWPVFFWLWSVERTLRLVVSYS